MITLSPTNMTILDSIKIAQITDAEIDKIVEADARSGEFDDYYYTNIEHDSFDLSGEKYVRHYKEWRNGYYLTLVKISDEEGKTCPIATAFVDLHYGDWVVCNDYRKKTEFLPDIVELSLDSNKWLAENGYRGDSAE